MSFGLSPMCQYYFYPRPPRGGRLRGVRGAARRTEISIHALREEGDSACVSLSVGGSKFLSTPSARRATAKFPVCIRRVCISIHALREEGDGTRYSAPTLLSYFYPRPPRGGRRLIVLVFRAVTLFLSTPSARRATTKDEKGQKVLLISIHALREEGDLCAAASGCKKRNFYPRPP